MSKIVAALLFSRVNHETRESWCTFWEAYREMMTISYLPPSFFVREQMIGRFWRGTSVCFVHLKFLY